MNMKPHQRLEAKDLIALKGLAILSCSNQAILHKRREQMVPHLQKEYRTLKHDVPGNSKKLFGESREITFWPNFSFDAKRQFDISANFP